MARNDSGKRLVELDAELLEFAISNCESNITAGMRLLQDVHDDKMKFSDKSLEKLVELTENFRKMKRALEGAR